MRILLLFYFWKHNGIFLIHEKHCLIKTVHIGENTVEDFWVWIFMEIGISDKKVGYSLCNKIKSFNKLFISVNGLRIVFKVYLTSLTVLMNLIEDDFHILICPILDFRGNWKVSYGRPASKKIIQKFFKIINIYLISVFIVN